MPKRKTEPNDAEGAETLPFDRPFELFEVQNRLDEAAARFDISHGGTHKFNNIRHFNDPSGANWTANFGVRGTTISLGYSVALSEMRETLRRVQSEMPIIRFDR